MTTQPHPRLYTVNEVAEYFGVTRWTVYKLVRDGDLTAVKVGERVRFRHSDVQAYLEREVPPIQTPRHLRRGSDGAGIARGNSGKGS